MPCDQSLNRATYRHIALSLYPGTSRGAQAGPRSKLAASLLSGVWFAILAGLASGAADPPVDIPGTGVFTPSGYVGHLTDHGHAEGFRLTIEPYGMPLIVRTVNVCMGDSEDCAFGALENYDPGWSTRLAGMASMFLDDDASQVGLIGLQETGIRTNLLGVDHGHELYCEPLGKDTFPAECLAAAIGEQLAANDQPRGLDEKMVGVVVGSEWEKRSTFSDHLLPARAGRDQGVIEALLEHELGLRLRFYSLRLEPGNDQGSQGIRLDQVRHLIDLIREHSRPGELPPIVVGDFNHYRDYHELAKSECRYIEGTVSTNADDHCVSDLSVKLMEKYFWRPLDASCNTIGEYNNIDIVYVARTPDFFGPPPCGRLPTVPTPAYDWLVTGAEGYFTFDQHRRLSMHPQVPRLAQAYVRQRTESRVSRTIGRRIGDVSVELQVRVLFDQPMDLASFSASDFVPAPDAVVAVPGTADDDDDGTPNCKEKTVYPDGRERALCLDCYPNPDNPTHDNDNPDVYDVCEFEVTLTVMENSLAEPAETVSSQGPQCLRWATVGPVIASLQGYTMDQDRDGYANATTYDAASFCIEGNTSAGQVSVEPVQQIHAYQALIDGLTTATYVPPPNFASAAPVSASTGGTPPPRDVTGSAFAR